MHLSGIFNCRTQLNDPLIESYRLPETKTAALSGRGRASLQADLNISDQSNNEDGGYLTGSIQSLIPSGRSAIAMPSGARPVRILLTTFRV